MLRMARVGQLCRVGILGSHASDCNRSVFRTFLSVFDDALEEHHVQIESTIHRFENGNFSRFLIAVDFDEDEGAIVFEALTTDGGFVEFDSAQAFDGIVP